MLNSNQCNKMYADLSILRIVTLSHADKAIERNDYCSYVQAEITNQRVTSILEKYFGLFEAEMPHEEFPEWPPASERPVFSDEEIDTWPTVVFSDGSTVDDEIDIPF